MRRGKRISRKRNNRGKRSRVVIRRTKKGGATEMNSDNVVIQKSQLEELNAMIDKHADEMKVGGFLGVARMVDKLLNQPVPAAAEPLEEENLGVEPNTIVNQMGNEIENDNQIDNNSMGNDNLNETNEGNLKETNEGNLNETNEGNLNETNDNDGIGTNEGNLNETNEGNDNNGIGTNEGNDNEIDNENNSGLASPETLEDVSPENENKPETVQGGGFYKRFYKSKKNKKSVML